MIFFSGVGVETPIRDWTSFSKDAQTFQARAEMAQVTLEAVRAAYLNETKENKKVIIEPPSRADKLAGALDALEYECLAASRNAAETSAFGAVLDRFPKARMAYQAMLEDLSPTIDWSAHDQSMASCRDGIRLLDGSSVPVYPVYMGSKNAKKVEYRGVVPIMQQTVYPNLAAGHNHVYAAVGRQVYRDKLPDLISHWGTQFQ